MKNIICLRYWWAFILLGCLTACHEYKMVKYNEKPAINFATLTDYDGEVDFSAGNLWTQYRYTYNNGIQDTLSGVIVVVQGNLEHDPLLVTLRANAVDDALMPEVDFLRNCHIPSGSYYDSVLVVIKCPELSDTLYAVDIVFDYEKSDAIAGTVEKQAFRIEVYNQVWSSLKFTAEKWEEKLAPIVGSFSRVKAKFLLDLYGQWGYGSLEELAEDLEESDTAFLNKKLQAYNDAHPGNPLKDEFGNLVVFEPYKN